MGGFRISCGAVPVPSGRGHSPLPHQIFDYFQRKLWFVHFNTLLGFLMTVTRGGKGRLPLNPPPVPQRWAQPCQRSINYEQIDWWAKKTLRCHNRIAFGITLLMRFNKFKSFVGRCIVPKISLYFVLPFKMQAIATSLIRILLSVCQAG